MIIRSVFCLAILSLGPILGCRTPAAQNDLRVEIRKVWVPGKNGVSPDQLQPESPAGRRVLVAIGAINQLREEYSKLESQLDQKVLARLATRIAELNQKITTVDEVTAPGSREALELKVVDLEEFSTALKEQDQISLRDKTTECDGRAAALQRLFEEKDNPYLRGKVELELLKTQQFLRQHVEYVRNYPKKLVEWVSSLAGTAHDEKLEIVRAVSIEVTEKLIINIEAIVANVKTDLQTGFGGFVTLGVFELRPSDPNYDFVLSAKNGRLPKDEGRAKSGYVLPEPLTGASASFDGDSSLIFVMESPGQIRVYQVESDPTALLRNVAILVQKAVSAAAKFLSTTVP